MKKYSPDNTFFGRNLTYLRKSKQMNQKKFAAQIGFKQTRISGWENDASYPDVKTLLEIADFFEVNLESLFFTDLEKEKRNSSDPDFRIGNTTFGELSEQVRKLWEEIEAIKEKQEA